MRSGIIYLSYKRPDIHFSSYGHLRYSRVFVKIFLLFFYAGETREISTSKPADEKEPGTEKGRVVVETEEERGEEKKTHTTRFHVFEIVIFVVGARFVEHLVDAAFFERFLCIYICQLTMWRRKAERWKQKKRSGIGGVAG